MKNGNRPTGIIRTLPNLYEDRNNVGHKRMLASFEWLDAGKIPAIYIALGQRPVTDVLHMYLLIGGKIVCRMNIASYEDGKTFEVKCWDEISRSPKFWAVCTAPISFPSETIARRGFQGFRYTEALW